MINTYIKKYKDHLLRAKSEWSLCPVSDTNKEIEIELLESFIKDLKSIKMMVDSREFDSTN